MKVTPPRPIVRPPRHKRRIPPRRKRDTRVDASLYFPWQLTRRGNAMGPQPDFPWEVYEEDGSLGKCWRAILEGFEAEPTSKKSTRETLTEYGVPNIPEKIGGRYVHKVWAKYMKWKETHDMTMFEPDPEGTPEPATIRLGDIWREKETRKLMWLFAVRYSQDNKTFVKLCHEKRDPQKPEYIEMEIPELLQRFKLYKENIDPKSTVVGLFPPRPSTKS